VGGKPYVPVPLPGGKGEAAEIRLGVWAVIWE
jgi:hypothetical protein